MIENVLDIFTNPVNVEGLCIHAHVCELTGICKDTSEVWDFIHIMAIPVFKIWPLVSQTLTVKINSRDTLRE